MRIGNPGTAREHFVRLLAVVVSAGAFGAACAQPPPDDRPPNIVFVLADDLGWTDVNAFDPLGRRYYETPHIDALAAQGMRFVQAYTNAANCAPTRAALMSGQYYPRQPIYHVGRSGRGRMIPAENAEHLPLEKVTLAEALRAGGYATGFVGKWHIGSPPETGPQEQGFDVNVGGDLAGNPGAWDGGYFSPNNHPYIDDAREGEYLTDYLTRKAVAFIEENRERPFYLHLSYFTPHTPLQAPEERVAAFRAKAGEGGHDNPTYAAMVASLDDGVGRLMQALDRLDLGERTIFIFYSDNGGHGGYDDLGRDEDGITDNGPLKAGKGSFYEGGIRVPLVVRWPGVVTPGAASDEPVIGIDFYPTLLEAAGVARPANYTLDGVSLMRLFEDPAARLARDALFWHFPGYPNSPWRTSPVSVIRSGRHKLMKFYEHDGLELYDVVGDVGEQVDLADREPGIRDALHARLLEWLDEQDAPMPSWDRP